MKNFDDIFSRKAKEAFDSYDADHLADKGWDAYVRKHGRKRSRAIIFPLWARAATVAVLVTIGVLITARFYDRKAGGPDVRVAQETLNEGTQYAMDKDDTSAASLEVTKAQSEFAEVTSEIAAVKSKVADVKPEGASANTEGAPEKTDIAGHIRVAELEVSTPGVPVAADLIAGVDLVTDPAEVRLTDDGDVVRLNLTPKRALNDYLVLPRERMTTTVMTGVSGMMARIGNAATTAQGVSIGFYVEQQLTRNISVRPGLAMARHAYSMESNSPGRTSLDYTAPELSGVTGTVSSYKADIEVLAMEVPVNFVFSVRKRARTTLFVSTGTSTLFYLNQRLSGSFDNTYTKTMYDANSGAVSYESVTTTALIESEHEFLNRVDFMGLANFSAGYSFPFSKTSHLLLEPFVQLPVKDLTSLNLRIRYGGLSMKIQF
jgi:hypothetical protein